MNQMSEGIIRHIYNKIPRVKFNKYYKYFIIGVQHELYYDIDTETHTLGSLYNNNEYRICASSENAANSFIHNMRMYIFSEILRDINKIFSTISSHHQMGCNVVYNLLTYNLCYNNVHKKYTFTCHLRMPNPKLQLEIKELLSFIYTTKYPTIKYDIFCLRSVHVDHLIDKVSNFRNIGIIIDIDVKNSELVRFTENNILSLILFYSIDMSDILKCTIDYMLGE